MDMNIKNFNDITVETVYNMGYSNGYERGITKNYKKSQKSYNKGVKNGLILGVGLSIFGYTYHKIVCKKAKENDKNC